MESDPLTLKWPAMRPERREDVDAPRCSTLVDLLRAPPSGERRLSYLHARPGCEAALRAHCEQHLATVAEIVEAEAALEQGWFGPPPVSAAARRRAGDLVLVARGDNQLIYPLSERVNARPYLGNHGALAADEMLGSLFRFNVRVESRLGSRFLVDLLWPEGRVVVEIDGWHHFRSPDNFRRDRRKDVLLQQRGYLVVRVLATDIVEDAPGVCRVVREALAERRSRGSGNPRLT